MFIDHRYKVLESLGTGHWANVFKVEDVRTGNLYTLKLFQYLSSEELYKHFKAKDMHHITKIEHPNLCHVVDFGHVGDHIYFISDYFDGSPLNMFKFTKTKVNIFYEIIVQICYALNALHSQDIMHRDIKPENILYKISGNTVEVKLIDFGFSRLELDKDTQYVSGTLPYIAPEVYLGKQVGHSSDLYSLGVMVYKMLTGSLPFTLEQINALRSGNQQYFIPVFPTEIDSAIPLPLEKLCLDLMDRNPESRFQNAGEVIKYINRITGKDYPYSGSWSLVNSLKFNSYVVREEIAEELLEHLRQVQESNGKIISLVSGEGKGKNNILSLFRYNILRGAFFIFDYTCTRTDHDAFFALIKEYLQSLPEAEINRYKQTSKMSLKLYQYLFTSEQASKKQTQTAEELQIDFAFAQSLLIELAGQKPVIFIIRDIQYTHHYTLDFLNFISGSVVHQRIMILLSCTEFHKIEQIEHTVLMNIPPFTVDETTHYITKLLNISVPERFCAEVHKRSAGNPYFVREILVDLVLRKQIYLDEQYHFPLDLGEYTLPSRLMHSVYMRMGHLSDENYLHLLKLSVVQTPITLDLIRYICKLKDQYLYSLLNDGKFNEILEKQGNRYFFSFKEAKDRLYDECKPKMRKLVSMRVLKYYSEKVIRDETILAGLIANAGIAGEIRTKRKYLLELVALDHEDHEQVSAYNHISEVLAIDFGMENKPTQEELVSDLTRFLEKLDNTGLITQAPIIWDNQDRIPELPEKYWLLGTIKFITEDHKNAIKYFRKAEQLATSPGQKYTSLLYLAQVYSFTDLNGTKRSLGNIQSEDLSGRQQILYYACLTRYHYLLREYDLAFKTAEEYLAQLLPSQSTGTMIALARLHNQLGEVYSAQKNVSEAEDHFRQALTILGRYHVNHYLGVVNNNLAELYLKQGYTVIAAKYSSTALAIAEDLGLKSDLARALLTQGEARIKLGEFVEAEEKLMQAREIIRKSKNEKYLSAIQVNLALAKSKIMGFGHYYQYIIEKQPKLVEGYLPEINPLIKTYFYYLSELVNPKKLRAIIRKNAHIDYQQSNELEFYHNVLSLMALAEKDYKTALQELKLASQFAGEVNNHYALAVFNTLQVVCFYGLGEYAKAWEVLEKARPEIKENQYRYWDQYLELLSLKLNLMDPRIPLRSLLRDAERQLAQDGSYQYYQLSMELQQVKIQILLELNAEKEV